jgi:hypothetical protein
LPSLKIGAFGSGFTAPIDAIGPFERIWQIGMEAQNLSATQVFRLDFRKTGETPWRSLAALAFTPHPTVRLTLGFASPPFQLSLGLNLAWGGWQGYQSLRYHRYLGRTLLSGMAYSLDLPH